MNLCLVFLLVYTLYSIFNAYGAYMQYTPQGRVICLGYIISIIWLIIAVFINASFNPLLWYIVTYNALQIVLVLLLDNSKEQHTAIRIYLIRLVIITVSIILALS